jgi:hypothetical protein
LPCFFDVESKIWEADLLKFSKTFDISEEHLKTLGIKRSAEEERMI